jgi:WD40 repeat protein
VRLKNSIWKIVIYVTTIFFGIALLVFAGNLRQLFLPGQTQSNTSIDPLFTPGSHTAIRITQHSIDDIRLLDRIGNGNIYFISYSPDGHTIAFVSTLGVYLFDVQSQVIIHSFDFQGNIREVLFSPDGQKIAIIHGFTVSIFHVSDWSLLESFESYSSGFYDIAFSPDSTLLAAALLGGELKVWEISNGLLVYDFNVIGTLQTVEFSPDGMLLAAAGSTYAVRIWRVADFSLYQSFPSLQLYISDLIFSSDGTLLIAKASDHTVPVWQVDTGDLLYINGDFQEWVSRVGLIPGGNELLVEYYDGSITLWQTSTGALLQTYQDCPEGFFEEMVSPDGYHLESGPEFGIMNIVTNSSGEIIHSFQNNFSSTRDFSFSLESGLYAYPSGNQIFIHRISDDIRVQTIQDQVSNFVHIVFSPDGTTLASISQDGHICLWRVSDGALVRRFYYVSMVSENPENMAFSANGSMLAIEFNNDRIGVWRVADGTLVRTIPVDARQDTIYSLSPNGTLLAVNYYNRILIYRITDGALLRTLECDYRDMTNFAFTPDGNQIITINDPDHIHFWEISTGAVMQSFSGPYRITSNIIFSADGVLLVVGSYNEVGFYRVSDGARIGSISSDTDSAFYELGFSSDGTQLMSSSTDGTLQVWGVP